MFFGIKIICKKLKSIDQTLNYFLDLDSSDNFFDKNGSIVSMR